LKVSILVGTLALVLVAGLGTPAFAVAPNFVISDPGGGDCTLAPINGVWNAPSKTCTVSNSFPIGATESLTVDAGATLVIDGGAGGILQVAIFGSVVNNGFFNIIGGPGNTDGAVIEFMAATSTIENNGSFIITGGSGVGSGEIILFEGTLVNNCGATMDFIGGTGLVSGRLVILGSSTVTSSPVSSITFTPGAGAGSGTLEGTIIPGAECPVVGGELLPIDNTALLLAGAQTFSWMIPVVLSVIGIGLFVVSRKSENS